MTNLTDEGLRAYSREFLESMCFVNNLNIRGVVLEAHIDKLAIDCKQVRDAAKKEERERCAKVAENATCFTDETSTVGEIIASAIRQMGGGK